MERLVKIVLKSSDWLADIKIIGVVVCPRFSLIALIILCESKSGNWKSRKINEGAADDDKWSKAVLAF